MQRASQDYDLTLDGNKFRLKRGETTPYTRQFRHSQVEESELFNPFIRGTMQSRPDFRGFYQDDWSGGQTWFKPTLPNSGGNTYAASSMFDSWTKPGNLIPLNQFIDSDNTGLHNSTHVIIGAFGGGYTVGDSVATDSTNEDVYFWTPASDAFVRDAGNVGPPAAQAVIIHGLIYDKSDSYVYGLSGDNTDTANGGRIFRFNTITNAEDSAYVTNEQFAAGSNIFFFDGRLMVYNGDTIRYIDKSGPTMTAVTDDGLGYDLSTTLSLYPDFPASAEFVVNQGTIANAIATERGVFYAKNVWGPNGMVEGRIFKVEVTDSGTYLRRPVGTTPPGTVVLGMAWHLDSLLLMVSSSQYALNKNLVSTGYPRVDLWHVTQGSMGAIGTFDGATPPSEAPYSFTLVRNAVTYLSSNQRLYAYDAIGGGLHHVFDYESNIKGGLTAGFYSNDSSSQPTLCLFGADREVYQVDPFVADPKVGAWAAGSYTMESNYFEFGVPLETKQLRSVSALFEKGSANETFYIDVQADDSGSWTTVATMLGSAGGVPITTDITASNVTGNRFQYRIRLAVTSGTNKPEFRAIGLKAISGETVEVFQFVVDATEIVNLENEIQRPDDVFDSLVTSARKNVEVSLTDHFGKLLEDAETSLGVRIDAGTLEKNDRAEGTWTIQVTRTAV